MFARVGAHTHLDDVGSGVREGQRGGGRPGPRRPAVDRTVPLGGPFRVIVSLTQDEVLPAHRRTSRTPSWCHCPRGVSMGCSPRTGSASRRKSPPSSRPDGADAPAAAPSAALRFKVTFRVLGGGGAAIDRDGAGRRRRVEGDRVARDGGPIAGRVAPLHVHRLHPVATGQRPCDRRVVRVGRTGCQHAVASVVGESDKRTRLIPLPGSVAGTLT